jgi:hypothetical protein
MHITVITLSETTIVLNVDRFDTILKIKELIAQQSGIPEKNQSLIFANIELNDKMTLIDYNVSDGSMLRLQMSTSLQKSNYHLMSQPDTFEQLAQLQRAQQQQPQFQQLTRGPRYCDINMNQHMFVQPSRPDPITGLTPK